jgi:hypothetical protein
MPNRTNNTSNSSKTTTADHAHPGQAEHPYFSGHLCAEHVAHILLDWRDGNCPPTSRVPIDFGLPEAPI